MTSLPSQPRAPEWVTSEALPVNGLDLLGLRVPAERIGLTLLAAVTTITPTIRYISLRAWIIQRYAMAKLPDDWNSFQLYAARVEAAAAIGNLLNDPRTAGLVGLDNANEKIAFASDTVKLEALVQQLAARAYTGPSNALDVTWSRDPHIPGLTQERGLPLADAVHELISETEFVRQLSTDPQLTDFPRSVLREFGAAFPIRHPVGPEREILIESLFPASTSERADEFSTYRLLLELAKLHGRKPRPDDVFDAATRAPSELHDLKSCLDGWLWYLARDLLAVTHEAAMKVVVDELRRSPRFQNADALLTSLAHKDAELEQQLTSFLSVSGHNTLDLPLSELLDAFRSATSDRSGDPARWSGPMQETFIIRAALSAGIGAVILLPLAWLLISERVNSSADIPQMHRTLLSYQGTERIGLTDVLVPVLAKMLNEGYTLRKACFELLSRTVNQHLRVAWTRLQQDPRKDVSLIQVDGSAWSAGHGFGAGRVASRISEGIGWLSQLDLVDENGCTQDGLKLLNVLSSSSAPAPHIV